MNPEAKKLWLEALRSGEYPQAQLKLRDDPFGYCCLGVLCDVYTKVRPEYTWESVEADVYERGEDNLPDPVRLWAGLDSEDPAVEYLDWEDRRSPAGYVRLSQLNDGNENFSEGPPQTRSGLKFDEIADLIERQL